MTLLCLVGIGQGSIYSPQRAHTFCEKINTGVTRLVLCPLKNAHFLKYSFLKQVCYFSIGF